MENAIALFDMDNTLFDYEGKLKQDLAKLAAPEETPADFDYFCKGRPWIKARRDLIQSVPGWWRSLPKFQLGWDIYHLADAIGFECHILTKGPKHHTLAWSEKVECIRDHFGTKVDIDIVGKDKKNRHGHVLVDDYPPYVLGWLERHPHGLVIMPAKSYNAEMQHPNIVKYNGHNMAEIENHLRAVKARKSGEHWNLYL